MVTRQRGPAVRRAQSLWQRGDAGTWVRPSDGESLRQPRGESNDGSDLRQRRDLRPPRRTPGPRPRCPPRPVPGVRGRPPSSMTQSVVVQGKRLRKGEGSAGVRPSALVFSPVSVLLPLVAVGQCGNQIGCCFWDLALREHATVNQVLGPPSGSPPPVTDVLPIDKPEWITLWSFYLPGYVVWDLLSKARTGF